jgi:hypothetical protein
MRQNFGRIYPSNIPTPDLRCGPGDDIVLFFGPERFQIAKFPYTFLYIDGDPMIILGKDGNAITIDYLLLNDTNGDNLVRIDKNTFWIKPTVERFMILDRSKLEIADHSGNVALALSFLNDKHLFIAGRFAYYGFVVTIDNKGMDVTFPNGLHTGIGVDNCFHDHKVEIKQDGLHATSSIRGATDLWIQGPP